MKTAEWRRITTRSAPRMINSRKRSAGEGNRPQSFREASTPAKSNTTSMPGGSPRTLIGSSASTRARDAGSATLCLKLQRGNAGDSKPLHRDGLFERRLESGLRVYYAKTSQTSVVILGGGDKSGQQKDIDAAADGWTDRVGRQGKQPAWLPSR